MILLVSIALMVINTFSAFLFDLQVGKINPVAFGVRFTSCYSGLSGSLMPLSRSTSDSLSASQSSSLSFGSSKSAFLLSQFSLSEMFSGTLSSSLSAWLQSILLIWQTFNTWAYPPARSFADKAGGKGDLSVNVNAAAPSCSKFDRDALMVSSLSEMLPMAVSCMFWVRDSFSVACRFWRPCQISRRSWTLAIVRNVLSSTTFVMLLSFSVSQVNIDGLSPANIALLDEAKCLTKTFWQTVSPVVLNCLQLRISHPREKLASTLIPCDMMENVSLATLERSAYFECICPCWHHQSVISSFQNVLLNYIGSRW